MGRGAEKAIVGVSDFLGTAGTAPASPLTALVAALAAALAAAPSKPGKIQDGYHGGKACEGEASYWTALIPVSSRACTLTHRCAMLHHEDVLLCVLPAAVPSVGAASDGLSSRSIAPTSPVAVRRLRTRAMTRLAQRDGRGAVLAHKGRHHTDR